MVSKTAIVCIEPAHIDSRENKLSKRRRVCAYIGVVKKRHTYIYYNKDKERYQVRFCNGGRLQIRYNSCNKINNIVLDTIGTY